MKVKITFTGNQGSGKTLLLNKIYEFLKVEGFDLIEEPETHSIEVLEPIETIKLKERS